MDILGIGPLAVPLLLTAYFAIGGVAGYFIAGAAGVVVGLSAMIGLLFGALVWAGSRR
jgi:hypothetical protein